MAKPVNKYGITETTLEHLERSELAFIQNEFNIYNMDGPLVALLLKTSLRLPFNYKTFARQGYTILPN